jgi:hypothetical protein
VLEPESLEIAGGNGNRTVYLYPLVWGDLDGGEVEDLLVSAMNGDAHGSMTAVRLMLASG